MRKLEAQSQLINAKREYEMFKQLYQEALASYPARFVQEISAAKVTSTQNTFLHRGFRRVFREKRPGHLRGDLLHSGPTRDLARLATFISEPHIGDGVGALGEGHCREVLSRQRLHKWFSQKEIFARSAGRKEDHATNLD
jgi:hypothetical protein